MAGVFISYRRSDSAAMCDRIYAALSQHFGKDAIFKDVDNIPLGVNFSDYIRQTLGRSSVAVIIIGRTWLDVTDAQGQRRLDDPADWVRLEIEEALALKIPVIPLRVDGAPMPGATSLPAKLQGLLLQNGWEVHYDPYFAVDMRRVTKDLERWLPSLQARQAAAQQAAYAQQQQAYQAALAAQLAPVHPTPVRVALPGVPPRTPKPPLPWRRINLYGGIAGLAAAALTTLEVALLFNPAVRTILDGPAGTAYVYTVTTLAGTVPAFAIRLRSGQFAAGILAAVMAETIWALIIAFLVVPTTPGGMTSGPGVLIAFVLIVAAVIGPVLGAITGVVGNWAAMVWRSVRPRRASATMATGGPSTTP